jgi:hypothetical protein
MIGQTRQGNPQQRVHQQAQHAHREIPGNYSENLVTVLPCLWVKQFRPGTTIGLCSQAHVRKFQVGRMVSSFLGGNTHHLIEICLAQDLAGLF